MEGYLEEVAEYRSNTVSSKSRSVYRNSVAKYLDWLYDHKPDVLSHELIEVINEIEGNRMKGIKAILSEVDPEMPPIKFEDFTAPDFMVWIASLRTPTGRKPRYSTYNGHRSALFNLLRDYGVTMSTTLELELARHFKGLKRMLAIDIANGQGAIKVGKDPLPFGLYRFLAKTFLMQRSTEFTFAQCFMVICWNLMCRSANAFTIKYEHMEWTEDALCVYFAHMKNDQTGERPRDPRHIYPNPLMPEICPVLSLGIFWLTYAFDQNNQSLYPGNNQYDRFRKILKKVGDLEEVQFELERHGVDSNDLGTHSMRKGAATYCSSGSTAGPSSSSIHLRAGWAMGGVQDTYLRYESAGDMYVGRVVSGLPLDKPEFAVVGPRFEGESAMVLGQVKRVFGNVPRSLIGIAQNALACLVYHHDFLLEILPSNHPVRQSVLITHRSILETLKPLVKCSLQNQVDTIPTGIPPHTSLLREMKSLLDQMKSVIPAIAEASANTVEDITRMLEDRAIGAGTVTREGLQSLLTQELERFLGQRSADPIRSDNGSENAAQVGNANRLFSWGGRLRRLPEHYELPNGTVHAAFRIWMCPDTDREICALRHCSTADFDDKNKRKRFGDLRRIMNKIIESVRDSGLYRERPTVEECDAMLVSWEEQGLISAVTPRGRERRMGQLKWTYVLKILRVNHLL